MSWVYVVLITLATRDCTIAGYPGHKPSRNTAPIHNSQPQPATRSDSLKPAPVWTQQRFRRTRRAGKPGLFNLKNHAVKRFFEFYPTSFDTHNVFSKPFEVTPKRYFHYSPFVRYVKGKNTPDMVTHTDGEIGKVKHKPFVNHFTGISTWPAPSVVNSVHDVGKLDELTNVLDDLKDGRSSNHRLDALSKLLESSKDIAGTHGLKLLRNNKHSLVNAYSGGGFGIQHNHGTAGAPHLPDSFSNMNQRSDWGRLTALGVTNKPHSEIVPIDFGDILPDVQHKEQSYIGESKYKFADSYTGDMFQPVLNSNPPKDLFGAFSGFVPNKPVNVFGGQRPAGDIGSFGMFGDIGDIDSDVLGDSRSVFSETKPGSSSSDLTPFANVGGNGGVPAGEPATNVPPKPHFGFDIPRQDAENGMQFFGEFSSDDAGCTGIEQRACIVDAECSCYGLYFCLEGACRSTLPDYAEDHDDQMHDGLWHHGPVDFPDMD